MRLNNSLKKRLLFDIIIRKAECRRVLNMIQANTRTPADRTSDLFAQVAAIDTGVERFLALIDKYDLNTVHSLASIENKDTQLTVLTFSDNPLKYD